MRPWLILLGGMIVWAFHFLALYVLASVFGSTMIARVGVALVTIACVAADGALLLMATRAIRKDRSDNLARWIAAVGAMIAGLSLVAVAWQSMPAWLG